MKNARAVVTIALFALMLAFTLGAASPAFALPAYCDCDYCGQVSPGARCTNPWTKKAVYYDDWCYYQCTIELSGAAVLSAATDPAASSEDGACLPGAVTTPASEHQGAEPAADPTSAPEPEQR